MYKNQTSHISDGEQLGGIRRPSHICCVQIRLRNLKINIKVTVGTTPEGWNRLQNWSDLIFIVWKLSSIYCQLFGTRVMEVKVWFCENLVLWFHICVFHCLWLSSIGWQMSQHNGHHLLHAKTNPILNRLSFIGCAYHIKWFINRQYSVVICL